MYSYHKAIYKLNNQIIYKIIGVSKFQLSAIRRIWLTKGTYY